ncbi:hypothetical protein ACLB2K_031194 [Fragaria x ananassa]
MVKSPPLKALSLFNSLTLQGFRHTHHSISFILHNLISSNLQTHAHSLILHLLSGRISSPFFTPWSLLHDLTQPNSTPLPTSSLLHEAIINAHVQSHSPSQALYYLNNMVQQGMIPTSNTFNNVLGFLVKSRDFEKAWRVFNEFKSRVQLDLYSFGIVVKSCCEGGELDRGFGVLDETEEMGWSPNVVIYTTLIDGCCKNGDLERAENMFCKMGEVGLVANQYTYTVLIDGMFKMGRSK